MVNECSIIPAHVQSNAYAAVWCHVPYAMLAHILRLPKKGVADLCLYKLQCNVYIGIKEFLAMYVAIDM